MEMEEDDTPKGGLIISDVSEFVSNLSSSAIQISSARPVQTTRAREQSVEATEASPSTGEDHPKQDSDMEDVQEEEGADNARSRTRAESEAAEDEDVAMNEPKSEEKSSTVVNSTHC